jgi:predicted alpha-1,2-mannosidase
MHYHPHLILAGLIATTLHLVAAKPAAVLIDQVDPFIGTDAHGHTFPGATVPHGMVQVSPDTRTLGWDACSGYHYSDSSIIGFSQTHFSGTGVSDLGDFLIMPGVGVPHIKPGSADDPDSGYRSRFSHDNESASPGYYKVLLDDSGITAELTATERVGLHRFTYPEGQAPHLVLDLEHKVHGKDYHFKGASIHVTDKHIVTGKRQTSGWASDRTLFFAMRFSRAVQSYQLYDDETPASSPSEINSKKPRAVFEFDPSDSSPLLVKVSISGVSAENALMNLDTELPHWDFEQVHAAAREKWEAQLQKITVDADARSQRIFYTALYHSLIHPSIYQDVNGEYRGMDGAVHQASGFTNYNIFSTWDTFRALHPLATLIEPERTGDYVQSMLAHYQQNPKQMLPIWSFHANETGCMIGYHSVPILADAFLKGLSPVSGESLLEAMVTTATRSEHEGLGDYMKLGYVPGQEKYKPSEGASKTLAYAYDDWCIAQVARAVGNDEIHQQFLKRSQNYRNVFDTETGYVRAKQKDGNWREPFDPLDTYRRRKDRDYTEGNAWNWSFYALHDIPGLVDLHGGREPFIAKLDQLFNGVVEGKRSKKQQLSDNTGLIGEYAQGNEPSHHVAYLYSYVGQSWRTEEKVHQILTTLYSDQPDGLPGNEDCGQMSAWYLFSAMGFYPVNPADGLYRLGTPIVSKASIQVPGGKTFTMTALNLSDTNRYVQSVQLNGKRLERSYITHDEILQGSHLEFVLGATPVKD